MSPFVIHGNILPLSLFSPPFKSMENVALFLTMFSIKFSPYHHAYACFIDFHVIMLIHLSYFPFPSLRTIIHDKYDAPPIMMLALFHRATSSIIVFDMCSP